MAPEMNRHAAAEEERPALSKENKDHGVTKMLHGCHNKSKVSLHA